MDEREYDRREYADVEDKVFSVTADYKYRWASLHGVFTNLKREPGEGNEEAIQPTWQAPPRPTSPSAIASRSVGCSR